MKNIKKSITQSWSYIAPFWPLKNLVATNPLAKFIHLPFEEALNKAASLFQTKTLPPKMLEANRQTIKWLQLFYDKGEAKIPMPLRESGLLPSVCQLLPFDNEISLKKTSKKLVELSEDPEKLIVEALSYLEIAENDHEQFLTLLLTTLPGWASYTQYRVNWGDPAHPHHPYPISHSEYLAFRVLLTAIVWPKAKELLVWNKKEATKPKKTNPISSIIENEKKYNEPLKKKLSQTESHEETIADAQLIFCIDVRSEQFRKKIETAGNYETLSMAGFFGLPIIIKNKTTNESYAACPPIVTPQHTVTKAETGWNQKHCFLAKILKMYQSIKYTFATPFALAEIAGPAKGFWMIVRNFFPSIINQMKHSVFCHVDLYNIDSIPLKKQIEYADNALKAMGIQNFAPVIIFCGHKSRSKNNIYETSLDCGACAGRDGLPNAEILVQILNKKETKEALQIPKTTRFFAGQHNTTNDTLGVFSQQANYQQKATIDKLLGSLTKDPTKEKRSLDWSQPRPEWGLARNASFIIAPRSLTKDMNLDGRAFLHSYDYKQDTDGSILKNIMAGPTVVTHWINTQYLFSTLDNTAFGGGSKITANVAGKVGTMQGNASDLMTGLALQSVYETDSKPYHEAVRLTVYVQAPQEIVDTIIQENETLKNLVDNEWIFVETIDR